MDSSCIWKEAVMGDCERVCAEREFFREKKKGEMSGKMKGWGKIGVRGSGREREREREREG